MNKRKRSREVVRRLRDDRREAYQRASEAITAGDVGPAGGVVSSAEYLLTKDAEATDGARVTAEEPCTIDLIEPAPSTLENADVMAVWSDLLELIADDPVTERAGGETDGR